MEYPYSATDNNPNHFISQNHLTSLTYGRQTWKIAFPSKLHLPGN